MKKTFTITYTSQMKPVRHLTVKGTMEQGRRFAPYYAEQHCLWGTTAIIREVA